MSQSSETFVHGGPSVPVGYQCLAGNFSVASPQPSQQGLLTGSNRTKPLSVEDILMMSGTVPNLQPQGGQLLPGGQPQGTQFVSEGQPQVQYIPTGQYVPTRQYIPQGQPQYIYVPQGQPQYQYVPQGQPHYQCIPQGYQPQGYQPPSGQSFV